MRRNPEHKPLSAKELAHSLPASAWRTVTWRQGSNAPLSSRFAAIRVRPSHREYWRSAPRSEEWFLAEWPQGDNEPTKYWLSTLPEDTTLEDLVDQANLRWRIERDYQELKQEIGLGHYESRGWRGFHHHATLSIAAYDGSAYMAYTRALMEFRKAGASKWAQKLAKEAWRSNKHIPAALAGAKRVRDPGNGYYTMGGEDEAAYYLDEYGFAWRDTPGAITWLVEATASLKPRSPRSGQLN